MIGSEQALYALLADTSSDHSGIQPVKIVATALGIELLADGFGDFGSEEERGSPLLIEQYEGRLRPVVWADIHQEDPTHVIDLSGAKVDRRNET